MRACRVVVGLEGDRAGVQPAQEQTRASAADRQNELERRLVAGRRGSARRDAPSQTFATLHEERAVRKRASDAVAVDDERVAARRARAALVDVGNEH